MTAVLMPREGAIRDSRFVCNRPAPRYTPHPRLGCDQPHGRQPCRYNAYVTTRTRPGITVRRFTSNAEAERHDAEYWRRLRPDDRVRLAWQLSLEQWELLGRKPDEPGLCRSVASVHRR